MTDEELQAMSRSDMCAYIRRKQLRLLAKVEEMERFAVWWNVHRPDEAPFPEVEVELRAMIRGLNIKGEEPLNA